MKRLRGGERRGDRNPPGLSGNVAVPGGGRLEVDEITVTYGGRPALDHASLLVDRAEVVALVGSNGAGKSSLLRAVAGMVGVLSGSVSYGGRRLDELSVHERAQIGVCLMPEGRELFGSLSVEENLRLGGVAARGRVEDASLMERFDLVLSALPELRDKLRDTASGLSGGQQQMVALGRILMGHPSVVLLDEPSVGLAPRVVIRIGEVIERLRVDLGISVLLAEQNIRMAAEMADRVYGLRLGKIVAGLDKHELGGRWTEQDIEAVIGKVG